MDELSLFWHVPITTTMESTITDTTTTNTPNPFASQGNLSRVTTSAVDTTVNVLAAVDSLSITANYLAQAAAVNAKSYARSEAIKAMAKEKEMLAYAKDQKLNVKLEDIDKYLANL